MCQIILDSPRECPFDAHLLYRKRSTNRLIGCARPLSHGKDKSQCVWGCLGVPSFLGTVSRLFNIGTIFYIYTYSNRYKNKISKNHTNYIYILVSNICVYLLSLSLEQQNKYFCWDCSLHTKGLCKGNSLH